MRIFQGATPKLLSPLGNCEAHSKIVKPTQPCLQSLKMQKEREGERRDIANYLNCITLKNGYWGN
jgi:hypothetical protein